MKKFRILLFFAFVLLISSFSSSKDYQIVNNTNSFWTLMLNNQVIEIKPFSNYPLAELNNEKLTFYALEMIDDGLDSYIIHHGFVYIFYEEGIFNLDNKEKIPIFIKNSNQEILIEHHNQSYLFLAKQIRELKNAHISSNSFIELKISILNEKGEIVDRLIQDFSVEFENNRGIVHLPCF